MDRQFTTPAELDIYLNGHKAGDKECSLKLVDSYHLFIMKYVKLLKHGNLDIYNKRMRNFVSLYVTARVRRNIHKYMHYSYIKKILVNTSGWFAKMFSVYDEAEIYNECVVALLRMAKTYKNTTDKPGFHIFVDRYYNFYIKRLIEKAIDNPIVRYKLRELRHLDTKRHDNNPADDDVLLEKINNYLLAKISSKPTVVNEDDFNLNWINGITASGVFKSLGKLERKILYEFYINDKPDKDIAYPLGYKAATSICRRRNNAKERIDRYGEDYNLLYVRRDNNVYYEETEEMSQVQRKFPIQSEQNTIWPVKAGVYGSGLVR